MNLYEGAVFEINKGPTYHWNDTKKRTDIVWADDILVIIESGWYCKALRLYDCHIFHFTINEMKTCRSINI